MKRKLSLLVAILILLSLSFSGCSRFRQDKFDAPGYVKAILDSTYKGKMPEKDGVLDTTEDKVQSNFDTSMEKTAKNFAAYYGIENPSQEILDSFTEWMKKVYSQSSYKVTADESSSDKVYNVVVTLQPINILDASENSVNKYIRDFNANNKSKKFAEYTKEQYNALYANGLLKLLNDYADSMTYREEVTVPVLVSLSDDNRYQADPNALNEISRKIIYLPEQ